MFLWPNIKCKIKHGTLRNEYENWSLKNVYVQLKVVSLKCSRICRLNNEFHHDLKRILSSYINDALGKNFKFMSNISIPNKAIQSLLQRYYRFLG